VATWRSEAAGRAGGWRRARAGRLALAAVGLAGAVATARGDAGPPADHPSWTDGALEIHFLDVGQGDAVLIRAPDGRAILYDGGPDGGRLLEHLDRIGVASLELVVASHNHADHIGGLVDAVERYRPRYVMENGVAHTTRTYERFLEAMARAGTERLAPTPRVIALGGVSLSVIPPPGDPDLGQNDNSVGLRVEYGAFAATLLGDSEPAQQHWWLRRHRDLLGPVQVHKASHHGSRHGDTRALLAALRPDVVVVSAADANPYGHPHGSAMARYREMGARILRTDLHGTVVVTARADGSVAIDTDRPGRIRPGPYVPGDAP
jgi:competence protein ComEC